MRVERIRELLKRVQSGSLSVDEALKEIRHLPFEDIGFAKIDHHRLLRRGFPEVIFSLHKTPQQVAEIAERMHRAGSLVLCTKAGRDHYDAVYARIPSARYEETARMIVIEAAERESLDDSEKPILAVIAAGTADLPIAEEAAVTASACGCLIRRIYDVGVAGLHRLLEHRSEWEEALVLVVVAGMEGALPSVVAGLTHQPVIAVPTSVGYGASFQGLAPLLTMLNSCAPGVAVVNIDNGFGAGYLAALIGRMVKGNLLKSRD
ncbi:MAG: nickel pincer cofactor biosynthesis protein LarB [Armatimonadetes bacterium]|nr:nickel pincer cofactor biosynthesis protein LarB [Armatimonadota bacterium]MDW8121245.1 nickel pincer cofactor biosynthesis protein LarB [Armatimonadota bacterium]